MERGGCGFMDCITRAMKNPVSNKDEVFFKDSSHRVPVESIGGNIRTRMQVKQEVLGDYGQLNKGKDCFHRYP